MRIAQVANFVGPTSGGMKTAVTALGHGYAAAGVERLLVVPGPDDAVEHGPAGTVRQLRGARVGGGYRLILEPWRVTAALEDFAPDSVEVCDKVSLLPMARWCRRSGVRCVLFSHERLDAMLALRTGLSAGVGTPVAALNQVLVRQVDHVVVTSEFARGEFAVAAAVAGTPISLVPLGVDLDTFVPRPARSVDEDVRLVHFGRLSREKSPHLAVAVALALHRRGVSLRMDVMGDGPQREQLQELAGDAPIRFHGHLADRDQVAALVADADVSVSVCPGETFGLAVLEALACGTPVVTSDRGGARELVDRRCGGWAAPDAESLADAVQGLLARPRLRRELDARRRAERYPWSRAVEGMLEVHAGVPAPLRATSA